MGALDILCEEGYLIDINQGSAIMKILIIEDEYSLADMIRECLEEEHHAAFISMDGEEGLYQIQSGIYDLVILDLMLPGIDGFQILKEMKKQKISVPVLILSARSELDSKLRGFELGVEDYLTKPFEMRELLARISVLLRRSMNSEDKQLSYLDLCLDKDVQKLANSVSGEEIGLGQKEYQLMEYFFLNPGRILSKEQITDRIWGLEHDVEYNNAEVYISFLRKKMLYLQSKARIRTIRNTGYILEKQEEI